MSEPPTLPLICVEEGALAAAGLSAEHVAWAGGNGFTGQCGRLLPLPGAGGAVAGFLFGTGAPAGRPGLVTGLAAAALQPGRYRLAGAFGDPTMAALGFRLGAYRFDRYRQATERPSLAPTAGADEAEVDRLAEAAFLARDLVNTPANDLGPQLLHTWVGDFAARHGMEFTAIVGDQLVEQNLPLIHAVGRAAADPPRLLDLRWGRDSDPRVTLVGKGVTFDTGGLDIKPAAGMALMKKDMGGAANVLGLAQAVVDAGLKVRLRVLLPIVENAISASAFRPGDVLRARNGLSVEIGNTDAEGRLILADALALGDEESPELLLDMATLTGAARTALGPDLSPLYTADDELADALVAAGRTHDDPIWRLPLWQPYVRMIASRIAEVNNAGTGGFAGSITAALFLQRFVTQAAAWAHLDIYSWVPEARPGRPQGGAEQGIRAIYAVLKQKYA